MIWSFSINMDKQELIFSFNPSRLFIFICEYDVKHLGQPAGLRFPLVNHPGPARLTKLDLHQNPSTYKPTFTRSANWAERKAQHPHVTSLCNIVLTSCPDARPRRAGFLSPRSHFLPSSLHSGSLIGCKRWHHCSVACYTLDIYRWIWSRAGWHRAPGPPWPPGEAEGALRDPSPTHTPYECYEDCTPCSLHLLKSWMQLEFSAHAQL